MAQILVEGWTERITYQLGADGAAPNLTGMTCVLLLYDKNRALKTYAGASGIETAATGIVYFDPTAADLVASQSPYSIRWKVTDGSGKVSYFPNADAAVWYVRKP